MTKHQPHFKTQLLVRQDLNAQYAVLIADIMENQMHITEFDAIRTELRKFSVAYPVIVQVMTGGFDSLHFRTLDKISSRAVEIQVPRHWTPEVGKSRFPRSLTKLAVLSD